MPERDNLVIVRAGPSSLHPAWLEGDAERNWDIVVSYFGKDSDQYREPDVMRIDGEGPKWPALYRLLTENPRLINKYKFIWLPDDDLMATKADINRLFDICGGFNLEVAQPALTWDSYISHPVTLRNATSALRFTNFVEIMAPCIASSVLCKALPLFNETLSGWGLDFAWQQMLGNREFGLAIIDSVSVRHTRPVGGPNYKLLREQGRSPMDEKHAFLKHHELHPEPPIRTHAAISNSGRMLTASNSVGLSLRLTLGHLPALRATPNRVFLARSLLSSFWHAVAPSRMGPGRVGFGSR